MKFTKFTKLLLAACVAALLGTCACVFAASENDEAYSILADEQTIMENARAALKKDSSKLQESEKKIKSLTKKKPAPKVNREKDKLEREAAALRKRIDSLKQEVAAREHEINNMKAKLPDTQTGAAKTEVTGWHEKGQAQIIAWNFNPGDKAVKLTVLYRKTRKTATAEAKFTTNKGDKFFLIDALPEGTQVVMPDDSEGVWTVNVDSRKDFVSKIEDPGNIAGSKLDSNSNKDPYGGKTFKSGEAFIILTQSGMTIRPPLY